MKERKYIYGKYDIADLIKNKYINDYYNEINDLRAELEEAKAKGTMNVIYYITGRLKELEHSIMTFESIVKEISKEKK